MPIFSSSGALCGRRTFLVGAASAVAVGAFAPGAFAKDDSLAQHQVNLIDYAAKQRMLIQRLAKLYAQSLVGARTSDSKRLIADSVSRFETINAKQNAAAEGAGSTTYDVAKNLRSISQDWPKLRALLLRAPSEKNLPDVIGQSEALAKLVNQTTGAADMFLSRSTIGQLMGISGKQCYISQRLATYYFLKVLKYKPEEADEVINRLVGDFEYNKAALEKGKDNTAEISFLLQLAGTQWPYFKDAIKAKQRTDATQQDYNVATAAENMLEVLERTNQLYYKLAVG